MIRLRSHHLMCILGWRQSGYSEAFTENFNRAVAELAGGAQFELVVGVDDICCVCFHNDMGSCRRAAAGASPHILDERVRALLRLEPGQIYDFASLSVEIRSKISPDDLSTICAGCNWLAHGWCRAALEALARA